MNELMHLALFASTVCPYHRAVRPTKIEMKAECVFIERFYGYVS